MTLLETKTLRLKPSLALQFINGMLHLCRQAARYYQRRRSLRALERLDDRLLKDVGLSRTIDGFQEAPEFRERCRRGWTLQD